MSGLLLGEMKIHEERSNDLDLGRIENLTVCKEVLI